jgi:uncharacterized membrane protein
MKNIMKKVLYNVGTFFYRQALLSGLKQRHTLEKMYVHFYVLTFDLKLRMN